MNYYGEPETSREADNANVSLIRATLQQATDHYPRLAALGFTLQHANPHSQQNRAQCKRAARTVLTGMRYSIDSATRQGSSSLTRFIGQSAMTLRT